MSSTDCPQCERLKAENKTLRETLERLRRLVSDMGGLHVKVEDSPYDDEAPLIVYEREEDK